MAEVISLVPAALGGGGNDEWVVGSRTFQSEGADVPIFDAGSPPRFQMDDTRFFHQIDGDQTWLTDAHKAGAEGAFEFWIAPGALFSAFNASYLLTTNQAGTPDVGVALCMLQGSSPGSIILRWSGGDVGGADSFLVSSTLEFFPGDFTQVGMSWQQGSGKMTTRFVVNGVTEELSDTYGGIATAASFEPHIGVGVGTGGHTHNNFFIGLFGKGTGYDNFLTEAELATSFAINNPGPPIQGCEGAPPSGLNFKPTLTRAYAL